MLVGNDLKDAIKTWAADRGELHARSVLLGAGLGYSTAILLIQGKYPSDPKARLVATLNKVLKAEKSGAAAS